MTGRPAVPKPARFVRIRAVGIALSAASAAVAVSYLVRLTRIRRKRPYIGGTEKNLRSLSRLG